MKKLAVIFSVFILFVSCTNPFTVNTMGYENLEEDLDTAWQFVSRKHYFIAGWQTPLQFESAGGGQCCGFAADLVYHLGKDAVFIGCGRTADPYKQHAIVYYHGKYIEPQVYGTCYASNDAILTHITIRWSYYELLSWLTDHGSKNVDESIPAMGGDDPIDKEIRESKK